MHDLDAIVRVGLAVGFVQKYDGANRGWLQVMFPDGSWEIMPEKGYSQKHEALLVHAHTIWSRRALRRMAEEAKEPTSPG